MKVIYEGSLKSKTAVALGNFDGLHIAHVKVIERAVEYARKTGVESAVLLFAEHTSRVVGENVPQITSMSDKLKILEGMEVDYVYVRDFDETFMSLTPSEFGEYLKNTLNACAVSVGYDYRFGIGASGDVDRLREIGGILDFDVLVSEEITYGGEAVKSSAIRRLVESGDVERASKLLGRRFAICGTVEKGLQNGRKLGFPTANVGYDDSLLLPKNGVYAGYTTVGRTRYKSLINIGNNPTFGAEHITVESHMLDFCDDIYGREVSVEFVKRLRDDKKFNGIDELKAQIMRDIEGVESKCIL